MVVEGYMGFRKIQDDLREESQEDKMKRSDIYVL